MSQAKNFRVASILLRIGLGFVFLYAAQSSLRHPAEWLGFLPAFLTKIVAANTLLKIISIYEILLVIWLVSGKFIKYCGLVCALTLIGIVAVNTSQLITTFRDVGLSFMGVALYFLEQ